MSISQAYTTSIALDETPVNSKVLPLLVILTFWFLKLKVFSFSVCKPSPPQGPFDILHGQDVKISDNLNSLALDCDWLA